MSASLVHPSASLGTVRPADPLGIVGGGSPLRPLSPSEIAKRLLSKTESFGSSVPVEVSSRERFRSLATSICLFGLDSVSGASFPAGSATWHKLPFVCVLCGEKTTHWKFAQLNKSFDCICRSCSPTWHASFSLCKSTFSFVQAGQRDAVAPRPGSTFQGRRRYFLNPWNTTMSCTAPKENL